MQWKEKLLNFENVKDWKSAIDLLQETININPESIDAYLSINYLLMNVLVEEDYQSKEYDYFSGLLKKYFLESYSKFSHDPQYLFYTGITAHISEWYFDIDIEEAKTMIKDALRLEPDNILFKWGYYTYIDMSNINHRQQSIVYGNEILSRTDIKSGLKLKGALGEYILGIIDYLCKK